jgi:hypothetical protein
MIEPIEIIQCKSGSDLYTYYLWDEVDQSGTDGILRKPGVTIEVLESDSAQDIRLKIQDALNTT